MSREGRGSDGAAVPLVPDGKTKELPMTADRLKAPAFRGAEVRPAREGGLSAVIGRGLYCLLKRFQHSANHTKTTGMFIHVP